MFQSQSEAPFLVSFGLSNRSKKTGWARTVIWELEVGHTVIPDQGLPETINPEGFDDPNVLGAYVDAVRWGAVTAADPKAFQSPFRAGVDLNPYQLEPLRRALESPRTNLPNTASMACSCRPHLTTVTRSPSPPCWR